MIQLDALKKKPERHTHTHTHRQKLTCRSSANFVSAGQKLGGFKACADNADVILEHYLRRARYDGIWHLIIFTKNIVEIVFLCR